MTYLAEYTDTFGGQPNYCWVRRATVAGEGKRQVIRNAKKALGLSGVRGDIIADFGDEWHWKPRGACTVLMVRWDDTPDIEG